MFQRQTRAQTDSIDKTVRKIERLDTKLAKAMAHVSKELYEVQSTAVDVFKATIADTVKFYKLNHEGTALVLDSAAENTVCDLLVAMAKTGTDTPRIVDCGNGVEVQVRSFETTNKQSDVAITGKDGKRVLGGHSKKIAVTFHDGKTPGAAPHLTFATNSSSAGHVLVVSTNITQLATVDLTQAVFSIGDTPAMTSVASAFTAVGKGKQPLQMRTFTGTGAFVTSATLLSMMDTDEEGDVSSMDDDLLHASMLHDARVPRGLHAMSIAVSNFANPAQAISMEARSVLQMKRAALVQLVNTRAGVALGHHGMATCRTSIQHILAGLESTKTGANLLSTRMRVEWGVGDTQLAERAAFDAKDTGQWTLGSAAARVLAVMRSGLPVHVIEMLEALRGTGINDVFTELFTNPAMTQPVKLPFPLTRAMRQAMSNKTGGNTPREFGMLGGYSVYFAETRAAPIEPLDDVVAELGAGYVFCVTLSASENGPYVLVECHVAPPVGCTVLAVQHKRATDGTAHVQLYKIPPPQQKPRHQKRAPRGFDLIRMKPTDKVDLMCSLHSKFHTQGGPAPSSVNALHVDKQSVNLRAMQLEATYPGAGDSSSVEYTRVLIMKSVRARGKEEEDSSGSDSEEEEEPGAGHGPYKLMAAARMQPGSSIITALS